MALWVIIPVKSIHNGKSRLAGVLSSEQREKLNISMLTNLLETLRDWHEFSGVMVTSHDEAVRELTLSFDFEFLQEHAPFSLNNAVSSACRNCNEKGATEVLILPADLPLINKKALQSVLQNNTEPPVVVITPDRRKEGTNSLLINPLNGFNFQFGQNSFKIHQQNAIARNYRIAINLNPEMELDLDFPEDWDRYQELILANNIQNGG
jgi:2-phospho-L-lactate/phosphoenolpyruvate guanylyltransferase